MKHLCLFLVLALLASTAQAKPTSERIARQVDRLLAEELFTAETELAPPTSDAVYLRRVWLDLVGDLPTPEDVTAFLLDPAPDKRDRVVRQLLQDPHYGQNWARYWRDVIMYRRLEDRALVVSNPLVADLAGWLNENRAWDEIAHDFLTASGDIRTSGATAIIAAQEGRTEDVTAEMSRIFLGIQIQCAQCHDHPYDSWKREQFHELAAYYPRIGLRPLLTPTRRSFEVVVNDQPERRRPVNAEVASRRGAAEHRMPDLEDPSAPGTRMQPRFFLTDDSLPFGTPDAERRGTLADEITANDWFAMALVNRMWSELVGEGFYEPIDDIGPERAASAPKAAHLLSQAFADSGYDLKWLCRTICATEAYQRESRPRRTGSEPPFAANVAHRLRGDQLFSAILTVLEVDEAEPEILGGRRRGGGAYAAQNTPRAVFDTTFGYDPSDPRDTVAGSIPQALAMMNMPRVNRAMRARGQETMLGRLLANVRQDDAVVDELYLRTLCRQPAEEERATALAFVSSVGNRQQAQEDLLWALMNSSEFLHRR